MHDLELTRLPQPPAADRSDSDDGETEGDAELAGGPSAVRAAEAAGGVERSQLQPQGPTPGHQTSRPGKASRTREGLPSGYRMRHAPHYVEQLMGGAPIQTVRHIAVDHLHPLHATDQSLNATGDPLLAADADPARADVPHAGIEGLAASIRRVGLLQPVLVISTADGRFGIIAGESRWQAARLAGLRTVPCLVVQADAARAMELRIQAGVRGAAAAEVQVERPAPAADHGSAPGHADVVLTALHRAVMADLAAVTARHASTRAAAAALLAGGAPVERNAPHEPTVLSWAELIDGLRRDASTEARLRGVAFEWPGADRLRDATADPDAIRTAWAAVLQAALAASAAGDRVVVLLTTPCVRPAIVFSVALEYGAGAAAERSAADAEFDATSQDVLLAAARKAARMHGGRLTVTPREGGVTIDFVVPQFFAGWD